MKPVCLSWDGFTLETLELVPAFSPKPSFDDDGLFYFLFLSNLYFSHEELCWNHLIQTQTKV